MDSWFDFTSNLVLITGGSRGLGLAMVREFARRGADVIIASPASSFTTGAMIRVDGGRP